MQQSEHVALLLLTLAVDLKNRWKRRLQTPWGVEENKGSQRNVGCFWGCCFVECLVRCMPNSSGVSAYDSLRTKRRLRKNSNSNSPRPCPVVHSLHVWWSHPGRPGAMNHLHILIGGWKHRLSGEAHLSLSLSRQRLATAVPQGHAFRKDDALLDAQLGRAQASHLSFGPPHGQTTSKGSSYHSCL